MVLRSGGGSPSRSCDLRSAGAIAIPDAGIDRYFSLGMGLAEAYVLFDCGLVEESKTFRSSSERNACPLTFDRRVHPVSVRIFNSFRHTTNSVTPLPSRGGQGNTFRRMIGFNPARGGVASVLRMDAPPNYRNCQKRQVAPIQKCPLTRARTLKPVSAFVYLIPPLFMRDSCNARK